MDGRLERLLNVSLRSMTMLSHLCHAQLGAGNDAPASPVWMADETDRLSTLGPEVRHLLMDPNESSTFWPRRPGAQTDDNHNARFVTAIKSAWKQGVVKRAVESYTEVLIHVKRNSLQL